MKFFRAHVIRYARTNCTDPRIPQALYLVVLAIRNSYNSGPGEVSQGAYAILQRVYAVSEWAEKAPYWYENDYAGGSGARAVGLSADTVTTLPVVGPLLAQFNFVVSPAAIRRDLDVVHGGLRLKTQLQRITT